MLAAGGHIICIQHEKTRRHAVHGKQSRGRTVAGRNSGIFPRGLTDPALSGSVGKQPAAGLPWQKCNSGYLVRLNYEGAVHIGAAQTVWCLYSLLN
jgi:hypothetical protein